MAGLPAYYATREWHSARGNPLKVLAFINWVLLGMSALMALLYAVVCLMMLPYPKLVAKAGGGLSQAINITVALVLFTAVAGIATTLLQKRHGLWWLGEAALAVALVGVVFFAWSQR